VQTHIATSGWFNHDWKGAFYPADLPVHRWFSHYTRQFQTVELNAPFYHRPTPATVKTWERQAPEHFRYSIKVNRSITHLKKFSGTENLIRDFYQIADILGPKMGCFLFQMPPSFDFTADRLEMILSQLDAAHKNVLEFRHASWWTSAVFDALAKHKIIFCSVSAPRLPDDLVATTATVYVRFHGPKRWFYGPYSDAELADWSARMIASGAREAWVYFNNIADGSAIANARLLKKKFPAGS
jgi:uncharacterized protein YecE (DUF72 family)